MNGSFQPLKNHSDAEYDLGTLYDYGALDFQHDFNEALKRVQRAATKGDSNAPYSLGYMYENGDGVGVDLDTAVEWYAISSAQGNLDAKNALLELGRQDGANAWRLQGGIV